MNTLVNVRLPKVLQTDAQKYLSQEGYTNMQDLIKTLLREYAQKKKQEEQLLALYGSQQGRKASQKELSALAQKLYGE